MFSEGITLIKLVTAKCSFIIDTKEVAFLVETELAPLLLQKLWIMVDGENDVMRLKEEFSLFPPAVFDMGKFMQLAHTPTSAAGTTELPEFNTTMTGLLGADYYSVHSTRKDAFIKHTEWGLRPLSSHHIQMLLGVMYFMMKA